jgi:branched-chain amino acid transport system ATP-binding protein
MVQQVVGKLAALKATGLTILLVEQNVHLALALSHHAFVIAEGRPFAQGPSAEIAAMQDIRQAYLGL